MLAEAALAALLAEIARTAVKTVVVLTGQAPEDRQRLHQFLPANAQL